MQQLEKLSSQEIHAKRDACLVQVSFVRDYLMSLLNETPHQHWFTKPDGCVSNVAWQVGHIAVAQYGLMLFRQRGRAEIDTELMPGQFRKRIC